MLIYSEIGIGNPTLINTEIEMDNIEIRLPGFYVKRVNEVYIRCWIIKTVYIISTKEGFKKQYKSKSRFKLLIGFKEEL